MDVSWVVFCGALWVAGLSAMLATLSMGLYRAMSGPGGYKLTARRVLTSCRYRLALTAAALLVLLGATLSVWSA